MQMPVRDCTTDGKPGRKCGNQGKCYPCSKSGDRWDCGDAFRRACAQCRAIGEKCGAMVARVEGWERQGRRRLTQP